MKRLICLSLILGFLFSMICTFVYANSNENEKLSDDLQLAVAHLKDGERISIYVILYDLDDDSVMGYFRDHYPMEYAEYVNAKESDVGKAMRDLVCDYDKDSVVDEIDFIDPINGDLLQTGIELKREIYRSFYNDWNHTVIDKYIATDNQIFVSQYSQMMIVKATKEEIRTIAKDEKVYSLDVFNDIVAISEMSLANEITRADYVRDHFGNKGSGVKIGMIEADLGKPDLSDSYLTSANIIVDSLSTLTATGHATRVARIMVGSSYGVAPQATLYCTGINNTTSFYDRIENYLLNKGVNIINMSAGFANQNGTYDIISKWTDHIASKHDVHFVKSAGNTGETNTYITSPGMGYNVITVGGYNTNNSANHGNHTLFSLSSFEEGSNNRPEKPNLVAPASTFNPTSNNNATCGLDFVDIKDYGTSYASPQVAGAIAQMCSYSSALKTKQSAMGAIVTAACEHKVNRILRPGSTERDYLFVSGESVSWSSQQISEKEGAGKFDARWSRAIIYNGRYWRQVVPTDDFPYLKTFAQNASTTSLIRVAIYWLMRNSLSTPHTNTGNLYVAAFDDLDLEVIGPNGVSVGTCKTLYSNFEVVQFVPTIGGTYTIKVTLEEDSTSNDFEYLGIAIW